MLTLGLPLCCLAFAVYYLGLTKLFWAPSGSRANHCWVHGTLHSSSKYIWVLRIHSYLHVRLMFCVFAWFLCVRSVYIVFMLSCLTIFPSAWYPATSEKLVDITVTKLAGFEIDTALIQNPKSGASILNPDSQSRARSHVIPRNLIGWASSNRCKAYLDSLIHIINKT